MTNSGDGPLVSILVPTYNRAAEVARAIDSALAQDHRPIEIIVSDNASTDSTSSVCHEYEEAHDEVRYIRQPSNVGSTANFEFLRGEARGDYIIFVGDDDWIDPDYVSSCLRMFEVRPTATVVAGEAVYHHPDGVEHESSAMSLDDVRATDRVATYLRTVKQNGVFYGLIRRDADRRIGALRNVMGGDWLYVASLTYLGHVAVLPSTHVHRTVGGMTASLGNVARGLGLGRLQGLVPWGAIIYWLFRDIAVESPVYADLGRPRRVLFGSRCAGVLGVRFAGKGATRLLRQVSGRFAR